MRRRSLSLRKSHGTSRNVPAPSASSGQALAKNTRVAQSAVEGTGTLSFDTGKINKAVRAGHPRLSSQLFGFHAHVDKLSKVLIECGDWHVLGYGGCSDQTVDKVSLRSLIAVQSVQVDG